MTDERALTQMFHEVLDGQDVSSAFQRLQLELEKPGAHTRRGRRTIFMTRNRLVLLAAALVLLLGISIVIGTRAFRVSPVGQTINAGQNKAAVAQLLARPLHLQRVQKPNSYADCPSGPFTYNWFGTGPVYGNGGPSTDTAFGRYWDVDLRADLGTKGPIVFRGQDIVLGRPLIFLTSYGTGPVYGTDTLNGKTVNQYTAIALDISQGHPYGAPAIGTYWAFKQGFMHGWSGCVGFQVDGPDFSETFYDGEPEPG